jgi:hypothetical protein
MVIQRFNDIVFEKKLDFFLYSLDEGLSFEDFKDKVKRYLPNIKTKEQAKNFLLGVIKKLKPKKVFIFKAVLLLNLLTISETFDLFKGTQYYKVVTEYREFVKPKNEKIKEFIAKLFQREAGGIVNATKTDSTGTNTYIGAFQFSKSALKELGLGHITIDKFKNNPNIFPYEEQEKALMKYMDLNEYYLRRYMSYIGKEINGVEITKSGILAAAHLVGQGKVKKFLSSNGKKDPRDGNGVRCSTYMKEFGGYDIE